MKESVASTAVIIFTILMIVCSMIGIIQSMPGESFTFKNIFATIPVLGLVAIIVIYVWLKIGTAIMEFFDL